MLASDPLTHLPCDPPPPSPGDRYHGQHEERPAPAPGQAGRDLRRPWRLRADAEVHAANGRQRDQAAAGSAGLGGRQHGPGVRGGPNGQHGVLQVRETRTPGGFKAHLCARVVLMTLRSGDRGEKQWCCCAMRL